MHSVLYVCVLLLSSVRPHWVELVRMVFNLPQCFGCALAPQASAGANLHAHVPGMQSGKNAQTFLSRSIDGGEGERSERGEERGNVVCLM